MPRSESGDDAESAELSWSGYREAQENLNEYFAREEFASTSSRIVDLVHSNLVLIK